MQTVQQIFSHFRLKAKARAVNRSSEFRWKSKLRPKPKTVKGAPIDKIHSHQHQVHLSTYHPGNPIAQPIRSAPSIDLRPHQICPRVQRTAPP
jgi:hypothetical protein